MKEINEKIDFITDTWNEYYLEEVYFQNLINFEKQDKTNFYAEILSYFIDTLKLIEDYDLSEKNRQNSIFNIIGLMQIIYVHQDLIDELLNIFYNNSTKKYTTNRNINRKIRNNLVGHPINKVKIKEKIINDVKIPEKIEYKSSYMFLPQISSENILYMEYLSDGTSKKHSYSVYEIIERHKLFLKESLNLIIKKIKADLETYLEQLSKIEEKIKNKGDLSKILSFMDEYYKSYFNTNSFSKEDIIFCFQNIQKEERYRKFIEYIYDEISVNIQDYIQNTKDKIAYNCEAKNKKVDIDFFNESIVINLRNDKSENIKIDSKNNMQGYYFKKLSQKKDFSIIDTLIQEYNNNIHIVKELENMKKNSEINAEYYSSYIYLKEFLLKTISPSHNLP